jgi:hypothetical protein
VDRPRRGATQGLPVRGHRGQPGRAGAVGAGDPVSFSLSAAVTPGTGKVVRVEWDFESSETFPDEREVGEPSARLGACETHRYDKPGTYFAVARVTSHRRGDTDAAFGLVQNLARVRVVVG